jgi:RHS repeat-associated protein
MFSSCLLLPLVFILACSGSGYDDSRSAGSEQGKKSATGGLPDETGSLKETASNAYNFRAKKSEWVNPRTGTLSCTTKDVVIPGRNGFNLVIESIYDQYNDENRFDLGKGWRFGFTFIKEDHTLYLGSGQAYDIIQTASGLELKHYKGNNLALYHDTTFIGQEMKSAYRLDYFGGSKEYFDIHGNLICGMDKFGNKIEYLYIDGRRLSKIIDSWGNIVEFKYLYDDTQLTIKLPDNREFSYIKSGNALNKLGRKVDFEGNTTYYKYSAKYGIINEINYPTGLRSLYYFTELKTGNGNLVAAVNLERDYPLTNDPDVYTETKYEYSRFNYTGYPHERSNEDPLNSRNDYRYSVTVTRNDTSTEYLYTNLHQLKKKTLLDKWKENVFEKTEYVYPSEKKNYDDLVAQDKLPEKVSTYFYKQPSFAGSTPARKLSSAYKYNKHEQLVELTDTDGVVGRYTYDETYGLRTKGEVFPTDGTPAKSTRFILTTDKKMVKEARKSYQKNGVSYELIGSYTYDTYGRLTVKEFKSTEPGTQILKYNRGYIDNATLLLDSGLYNVRTLLAEVKVTDYLGNISQHVTKKHFTQESGLLIAALDALGNRTQFEYNKNCRLIKQINADNTSVNYAYTLQKPRASVDNLYNQVVYTNELGYKTRIVKDSFLRPRLNQEYSSGSWHTLARYDYDKRSGVLKWQEDVFGNRVTFYYDELLRLKGKKYNATGDTLKYYYDRYLNRKISVNEEGEYSMVEYDNKGRHKASYLPVDLRTISPLTLLRMDSLDIANAVAEDKVRMSKSEYNDLNQLIKTTDVIGNSTLYNYDDLGRQVKVVGADGNTVEFEYNLKGKVTKTVLRDLKGSYELATSSYNELGQLLSATDQLGKSEYYKYDAVGNITWKKDRKANEFTYSYNQRNRLTQMIYGGGSVSFNYNDTGQLASMNDLTGKYMYAYNLNGTLASETYPDTRAISYKYDAMNRMVEMKNFAGKITTYEYDKRYQLAAVKEDGSDAFATRYSYYSDGLLKESVNPAGVVTRYTFDNLNKLVNLENSDKVGGLINSFSYTYDKIGNCASESAQYADATLNTHVAYTYDKRYRLTDSLEKDYQNNLKEHKRYQFDTAGNITEVATLTDTTVNSYDAASRLIAENSTVNGVTSYQYDANGNLTHKNSIQQYYYDTVNRLNKFVSESGTATTYAYRGDGLRMSKTTDVNSINFYYHKKQIVNERAGANISHSILGKKLISREHNGAKSFYVYNSRGDVTSLVNNAGSVVNSYDYEDYGDFNRITETVDNPFKYSGQYHDQESDLYYLSARYYSPKMRRFITVDPIKDGYNWYAYCGGNPVMYSDPSGLRPARADGVGVSPSGELAGGSTDSGGQNISIGPLGVNTPTSNDISADMAAVGADLSGLSASSGTDSGGTTSSSGESSSAEQSANYTTADIVAAYQAHMIKEEGQGSLPSNILDHYTPTSNLVSTPTPTSNPNPAITPDNSTYMTQDYDGEFSHVQFADSEYGNGVDVASGGVNIAMKSPFNDPVKAVYRSGTGDNYSPYGNRVYLYTTINDQSVRILIAHLAPSSIFGAAITTTTISQGQVIGLMGSTGNSTGIHAHVEVHAEQPDGTYVNVNPHDYLNIPGFK